MTYVNKRLTEVWYRIPPPLYDTSLEENGIELSIILLCGGTKGIQSHDIDRARRLAEELQDDKETDRTGGVPSL